MSVRPKGKGWEVAVYLGEVEGKKRYSYAYAATKREAVRLEKELAAEVIQGKRTTASNRTLSDLLDAWMDNRTGSPVTLYSDANLIKNRLKPALGNLRLRQVTPQKLDAYFKSLRDEGLSPNTVRNVRAVLRSCMAQGVRWGWISSNPVLLTSPGRTGASEVKIPTMAELVRLLAVAQEQDPDLHAVLWFKSVTGARRSEVCGLRWSDFDFGARSVMIRRAVVDVGGKSVVKDTKTHATRTLALDDTTVHLLKAMKIRAQERLLALGGGRLSDDAYVYSTDVEGLTPILPATFSKRFMRACKAAGLEGIGIHGLRHAAATFLIGNGSDVRTVAKRLGHSDPSMTLRVYSHALQERDRAAADALGKALG